MKTTEEASARIADRVCRVTLDLKVHITEVTPEILRRSIFWDAKDRERSFNLAERQNRLLHAFLRNQDVLHQFLAYVAMSDLKFRLDAEIAVSAAVQNEDLIFHSVLSSLRPEEAALICGGHEFIGEEIELLHQCFSIIWEESILSKIEVMPSALEKEMR